MADLKMNLSQLETKRDELIKEVDSASKDMTNKTYDIDFVNNANINKTLSHLDKNYKWTVKNAALLINLHEASENLSQT